MNKLIISIIVASALAVSSQSAFAKVGPTTVTNPAPAKPASCKMNYTYDLGALDIAGDLLSNIISPTVSCSVTVGWPTPVTVSASNINYGTCKDCLAECKAYARAICSQVGMTPDFGAYK